MIPLASFEPDRADYAQDAAPVITNAMPVADGHGPLKKLVAITGALAGECRGAVRVRTPVGVVRVFAATASRIYELNSSTLVWDDKSGPSAPYALPAGDEWSFTLYGDTLVASNQGTNHQFIGVTSGTAFADVAGSPPRSKYTWTAGEYFCLGNIVNQQQRIMTSGYGDLTWWTVGQRGCDFQDFPDGGEIMGGITADNGAVIFQREKLRLMNVAQVGDYSFTTSVLNPNRGTVAPLSICQIGPGQFFYYSSDGFMLGAEGRPIGANRVDNWFSNILNPDTQTQIKSVADPLRKIVWTTYQGGTNFLLGYHWQLDRWCYANIPIGKMVTMAMPTLSWDTNSIPIDTDTEAFDASPGNLDRFAAFDTSNQLGFFTGVNLAATLETADIELAPGRRAWLKELATVGDCADYTMQVGTMEKRGGAITWGAAASPFSSTGLTHFRSPGRFHRVRKIIPEGATWSVVTGVEPDFTVEGKR